MLGNKTVYTAKESFPGVRCVSVDMLSYGSIMMGTALLAVFAQEKEKMYNM